MSIKVGIPRSLFYYKFFPLWKTFLEELGAEVVVSEKTNRRILDNGVKYCVDEACLPIKLFHGHVLDLAGKVDYILIPRFTSISKNEFVCPEFGGLPDMIRHSLKNLPPVINVEVNLRKSKNNSWRAAYETGSYLTDSKAAIKKAYKKAAAVYRDFRVNTLAGCIPADSKNGLTLSIKRTCGTSPPNGLNTAAKKANKLRIAVIGHAYNIYDPFINMDLIKKLDRLGAEAITVEMVDEELINSGSASLHKPMFWNFGRHAVGSVLYLKSFGELDGIIYVLSFGCGIDSFVSDLIERKIRRDSDIPFTVISLDEHSGEAGINTRLEAFIDMIGWRKGHENNISASGEYIH